MDSFVNTFHIDWKIIIAQVINFAVVLFAIQFLALKPIKKLMKERTERINMGLEDAVKNAELLKNTKKEYNDIIVRARAEANEIFQAGKNEAEEEKRKMLQVASKEVEDMILNGKKVLEAEKVKMVNEAKGEIVSLVVKATEKILDTHKNDPLDDKILDQINKI